MPFFAASAHESGLVPAIQIGGCGSCTEFGITSRSGTFQYFPPWENFFRSHMRGIISSDSSHMPRVSRGSMPMPVCS